MKDDILAEWTAYGVRVLTEVGYPAIEAHVQAELVAGSILREIQGTQTYIPRAALLPLRDQVIREEFRAGRQSIDQLAAFTRISKSRVYSILHRKAKP